MFLLDAATIQVRSSINGRILLISKSTAILLGLRPGQPVDADMARKILTHEAALAEVARNFAKLNVERRAMLAKRTNTTRPQKGRTG